MTEREKRGLLSIGVFFIILVVAIILYTPIGLVGDWTLIPPLIIALFGCWTIALAGIRASNPQKYERGPFSTFAWGLLLIAVGGAWFLYGFNPLYSLALILLVFGTLAIVAALRKK
jgi:hypothetical protein